jgi:putative aldouronate transport system permease protein
LVVAVGAAARRWAPPRAAFLRRLWKYRGLYALLLPALIYFLVCHFYPYLLMMIAFKEYSPVQGVWGSPWVGFKYF